MRSSVEKVLSSKGFYTLLERAARQQLKGGGREMGFAYVASKVHSPFFTKLIYGDINTITLDVSDAIPSRIIFDEYNLDHKFVELINLHFHALRPVFGKNYDTLLLPSVVRGSDGGDLDMLRSYRKLNPSINSLELVAGLYSFKQPYTMGVLCIQEIPGALPDTDEFRSRMNLLNHSFDYVDVLARKYSKEFHMYNEFVASMIESTGFYKASYILFKDGTLTDSTPLQRFSF